MLAVKLAGLGWYLPERRVMNAELEERLDIPANWIERATGVLERRYIGDETVVSMGAAASRMALEDAGLSVGDLVCRLLLETTKDHRRAVRGRFLRVRRAPAGERLRHPCKTGRSATPTSRRLPWSQSLSHWDPPMAAWRHADRWRSPSPEKCRGHPPGACTAMDRWATGRAWP